MLNRFVRAICSKPRSAVILALGLLASGYAGAQAHPLTARAAGVVFTPVKNAAPSWPSQVKISAPGPTCTTSGTDWWANQDTDPSNTFDGIATVQYGSDWQAFEAEAADDFIVPACDKPQRFYMLAFQGYLSAPRAEGYAHAEGVRVVVYKDADGKPGDVLWEFSPFKRYSGDKGMWFEEEKWSERSNLVLGCGNADGDSCNHSLPRFPPTRKATRYWISIRPYLISSNYQEGNPDTTGPWFWALRRANERPFYFGASAQWRGGDQLTDNDGNANTCTDWGRLDACPALGLKKKYELQMRIVGGVVGDDTGREPAMRQR